MGLFSSVIHLKDVEQIHAVAALDNSLARYGISLLQSKQLPRTGPYALEELKSRERERACYLVSKKQGNWLTIIEVAYPKGGPWIADLSSTLSKELGAYTIALHLHDDDVFYYNLVKDGMRLDGYNSLPQYFEKERISDKKAMEERHNPEAFAPLLPNGVTLNQLEEILLRGWWAAFDSGTLDENGCSDDLPDEYERMTDFGKLLQLSGSADSYPYTAWGDSRDIHWDEFVARMYAKTPS